MGDYFATGRATSDRYGFRGGRIRRRAESTESHCLICGNVAGLLWVQLKGSPWQVDGPSLRVRSGRADEYVYPDVTVVGRPADVERRPADLETVTHPRLTVEVPSTSTQADDRGDKFDGYRDLPTFEQYVLVAQDPPHVQTFTRHPRGGWLLLPYVGLDAVVPLGSSGVDLPTAEVYAGVTCAPAEV